MKVFKIQLCNSTLQSQGWQRPSSVWHLFKVPFNYLSVSCLPPRLYLPNNWGKKINLQRWWNKFSGSTKIHPPICVFKDIHLTCFLPVAVLPRDWAQANKPGRTVISLFCAPLSASFLRLLYIDKQYSEVHRQNTLPLLQWTLKNKNKLSKSIERFLVYINSLFCWLTTQRCV